AARVAVGRQDVIRSGAVVAQRLGRPGAEKHRTRAAYLRQPVARLAYLQQQVLGGVLVGDGQCGGEVRHEDAAAGGERLLENRAARESRQRARERLRYEERQLATGG